MLAAQQALYSTLDGDGTLDGLIDKVYDSIAPQDATTPYAVISNVNERRDDTFTKRGRRCRFQVDFVDGITDARRGKRAVLLAAQRAAVIVDNVDLGVTGYDNYHTEHIETTSYIERDQETGRVWVHVPVDFVLYLTES
jgi:hypothetical protein